MSLGFLFEDFAWDESGAPGGRGLGAVEEDSPCESWAACDAGTVSRTKAAAGNNHGVIALRRAVGHCI